MVRNIGKVLSMTMQSKTEYLTVQPMPQLSPKELVFFQRRTVIISSLLIMAKFIYEMIKRKRLLTSISI